MNPHGCRVVLRPRHSFEVFDLTCAVLRETWLPTFRLALAVLLVPCLVVALIAAADADVGALALGALVLATPALQAPFVLLGARALFGRDLGVRSVLGDVWELRGAMLALGGLVTLGALASVCSLMMLAPVIALAGLFVSEALLLERKTVVAAAVRSAELVSAGMGRALLGGLALIAAGVWFWGAVDLAIQTVVEQVLQLGTPFPELVTPWMVVSWGVAQPVLVVFRLLLYIDVRTVVEGWDVQVALRAAAEVAP